MTLRIKCICGNTIQADIFADNHVKFVVEDGRFDDLDEVSGMKDFRRLLLAGSRMTECSSCRRILVFDGAKVKFYKEDNITAE